MPNLGMGEVILIVIATIGFLLAIHPWENYPRR